MATVISVATRRNPTGFLWRMKVQGSRSEYRYRTGVPLEVRDSGRPVGFAIRDKAHVFAHSLLDLLAP